MQALRHWKLVRYTSLPLVFLFLYFVSQLEQMTVYDRMSFISWVQQPLTTFCLLAFIACGYLHACLGMDEIIEDYISDTKIKNVVSLGNRVFFLILGLVAGWAVLKIHSGDF